MMLPQAQPHVPLLLGKVPPAEGQYDYEREKRWPGGLEWSSWRTFPRVVLTVVVICLLIICGVWLLDFCGCLRH